MCPSGFIKILVDNVAPMIDNPISYRSFTFTSDTQLDILSGIWSNSSFCSFSMCFYCLFFMFLHLKPTYLPTYVIVVTVVTVVRVMTAVTVVTVVTVVTLVTSVTVVTKNCFHNVFFHNFLFIFFSHKKNLFHQFFFCYKTFFVHQKTHTKKTSNCYKTQELKL